MRRNKSKLGCFIVIVAIVLLILAKLFAPDYFYRVGMHNFNSKKYVQAREYFNKALMLDSKNEDYRYYYVQALAKFKPTYEVQKEMFKYANDDFTDGAHVFAGIQVNAWKRNLLEIYGSNYIEQVPMNNMILRWNLEKSPLKIYTGALKNMNVPTYYTDVITRAFGQWTASTRFLKFNFIDNPDNADILVLFDELPANNCDSNGCRYVVGYTSPTIKKNVLKRMTIVIYDRDAQGNYFSDRELYNTVLHEIGHALGIMGHSYSTNDLMYMGNQVGETNPLVIKYRSEFQYISYQDVNTIRLLYNMVPDITNTSLSDADISKLIYPPIVLGSSTTIAKRKLREAQVYVKRAPNLAGGYVDLGIAYGELGDTKRAVDAFTIAFNKAKGDQDKYIVLYNMAAMYLNQNKLDLAMQYAKQTQKIANSEEVKELIGNIEHAKVTKSKPFWTDFLKK